MFSFFQWYTITNKLIEDLLATVALWKARESKKTPEAVFLVVCDPSVNEL
jgi:hypothetical protein